MAESIRRTALALWLGSVLLTAGVAVAAGAASAAGATDPNAPAEFTVTTDVLRPADKVPPLGANNWGRSGAVEWAANNFVHDSGNEPIYWRNLHRAKNVGPNWFEIDGPGTSWYDLWASGFLSGADLRIYRLVDKDGKSLPPREGNPPDAANADHVLFVGKGRVIPEGAQGFPDGGWVANTYTDVYPDSNIRNGNLSVTDTSGLVNGRAYWYAVVAVSTGGESAISNEASVTPAAGADTPPHLLIVKDGDQLPDMKAGADFRFDPKAFGGKAPYTWQAEGLPVGLKFDAATGAISGKPAVTPDNLSIRLKVTDAAGRSDVRTWIANPKAPAADPAKTKPQPPSDLKAAAGDGCVTLSWAASPSPNVVAYCIKRSTAPAAQQVQRVYVTADTPPLQQWDYVVLQRRFDNFDMRYVNSRVRGIGNPMDAPSWYWNGDLSKLSFSLVAHPQPVPADMVDPGETCMQVKVAAGEQSMNQLVFIGTQHGGESVWYGQLEPGKNYRLEVWLMQKGLANDGAVTFSYGRGYPDIHKTFQVTGEWQKFTFDFTGPERPRDPWHFGQQFNFIGPGTLWMDNCRVFRYDSPEDLQKPYVPNPTVLAELLKTQPETGPKAAHRVWVLSRDATMSSILSWHANSSVSPDWSTGVEGTMDMTVPMALTFDLATGKDPQSRMRPWFVIQHILHSEEDWLNFIEYMAAPYDPAKDTPQSKPWAYKRYQQRGIGTPWTDEFSSIVVEFGNETWHNGYFPDWLGFAQRNAIHQGGREYGLFTRYLVETMMTSPYWKSQGLDKKIRFSLGANYDGQVRADGKVTGYGEEAMQANPYATVLGHANYVGPKWETGDYSARTYDDHGVQECLLSFLTGPEASQIRMSKAHDALAAAGHAYDISAYEGGPGGYALPGGGVSAAQVETNEKYGKSLAQAVGALDAWMRSYIYGWTDQCFLGYGQGSHWNSHTDFADGFRPTPAWLALTLRNRYASGDLMAVTQQSGPTILDGKATYPLLGAYAMRDGSRWAVFVVSRKLDGKHDNADFGSGFTPVTLHLPFAKAGKIELHTLAGDPRKSNMDAMNISIQSKEVPAGALQGGTFVVNDQTGGGKDGMPPGSVFLYVFEDTVAN